VRLLDRTTRSVVLTDEGRRFYEKVKPHLNAIEDAAIIASGAISAVRGRLKVDIDPFFLPLVLAGRLGVFCERHPELVIEFVTSEHIGDLVSEGIDLAIRFGQPRLSTLVSRRSSLWLRRAISSDTANPSIPRSSSAIAACNFSILIQGGRSIGSSSAARRASRFRPAAR
jgi:DNA-binding transcriptional LysR family regulator